MEQNSKSLLGHLPNGVSNRLSSTYSSVTAGVGNVVTGPSVIARPELDDVTTQSAFEKYKEYNTNTNLRINQKHLWAEISEKIAGSLLTGATIALGTMLLGPAGISITTGVLALGGIIGASIGVYYAFKAPAVREQSERYMDVDDYKIKRQAGVLAKEIKKALEEDISPAQDVAKEPANENRAPKTQLAASSAALESTILDAQQRETVRA